MNLFEIFVYQPLYNIIILFYHLLGNNLGFAIIAIGLISRAVLIPVTLKQVKMSESGREFNEKSKEVKERFKNDKERQTQELLKLQQEYLPAQLGGCLPLIFQVVIFINIYGIIRDLISNGASSFERVAYPFIEKVSGEINTSFLGILDLKVAPNAVHDNNIIPYIILLILVGITQYFSMKVLMGIRKNQAKDDKKESEKSKKKKKDSKNQPEDFAEIMQQSTNQAMSLFPFLLIFVSYGLPAGLSVYLITTSLFVILQQSIFFELKKNKEKSEEK